MSRLFVAIRPPADLLDTMATAIEPLAADPPEGLRITSSAQWHVTLRFLGDADAAAVAGRLRAAELPDCVAEVEPVASVMGHVVIFDVSGVEALAEAVLSATEDLGDMPAQRVFRGHVTVGRIRRHGSASDLRERLATDRIELRGSPHGWRPQQVELVSSRTEPDGAVHEVIGAFQLRP